MNAQPQRRGQTVIDWYFNVLLVNLALCLPPLMVAIAMRPFWPDQSKTIAGAAGMVLLVAASPVVVATVVACVVVPYLLLYRWAKGTL